MCCSKFLDSAYEIRISWQIIIKFSNANKNNYQKFIVFIKFHYITLRIGVNQILKYGFKHVKGEMENFQVKVDSKLLVYSTLNATTNKTLYELQ